MMDKTLGQIADEVAREWQMSFAGVEYDFAIEVSKRFAAAVKEEDARICETLRDKSDDLNNAIAEECGEGHFYLTGKAVSANRCAAAIRASIKEVK